MRNKNTDLMATTLQGKIEGRRKPGRPSITYIDNIKKTSSMSLKQISYGSQDRGNWRRDVWTAGAAANIDHDDADR